MRTNEDIITVAGGDGLPFKIALAGTTYPDPAYKINRRKSDITVVEYVLDGCGTVKNNSSVFYPCGGDTYILRRGGNHVYGADRDMPWTKIWFNVMGALPEKLFDMYGIGGRTLFKGCNSGGYIRKIHEICRNGDISCEEIHRRSAVVFFELVQFLAEFVQQKGEKTEAELIKDFLDANLKREVTVGELAELISKSPSQTIRIFKNEYNVTPYEYFIGGKIELASAMLKSTSMKIKDIAAELSFYDEHYFSMLFKKKIGITPGEYRRGGAEER